MKAPHGEGRMKFGAKLDVAEGRNVLTTTITTACNRTDSTRMIVGSLETHLPELKGTMDYLHSSDKIDQLLENINSGTALAVSDGSYYHYKKIGAAAWIITTPDETQWIKGGAQLACPHI